MRLFSHEIRKSLVNIPMNAFLIDWVQARELFHEDGMVGSAIVQKEIWSDFKKAIKQDLANLSEKLQITGDDWRKLAHSIQGYASTAGAIELGRIFREAQEPDNGAGWLLQRLPEVECLVDETCREMEHALPYLS